MKLLSRVVYALILLPFAWLNASVFAQGMPMGDPIKQFTDSNADPLALGTVAFFQCGTAIEQDTFSDYGLSVINPNPITLNAAGRPSVSGTEVTVFLSRACYKIELKNAAGVTIYAADNQQTLAAWNIDVITAKWQALAPTTLTVSSNTVTPTRNVHRLDSSGGAATVNTIATTNVSTGFILTVTANNGGANPITIADGAGNIELAGGAYILNAADLWLQLVLSGTTWYELGRSSASAQVINNGIADGRLTLTTATAVTSADVTAATSVYYTPYKGSRIALYNGTTWNVRTFTELTFSLAALAADTNFDVFVYDNAGTVTADTLVAWTNATTRATAIVLQDGVYVKSGATTRRYVGTIRTTGTIGQCEDSFTKRFVWNYDNRVRRAMRRLDTTDSWTYTTATYRQANGAATNQIEMVIGVAEVSVDITVVGQAANSSASVLIGVSIGQNSTSTPATGTLMGIGESYVANDFLTMQARLVTIPPIGYQYFTWLEYSAATGTTTWYGDGGGGPSQSGIAAQVEG